MIMSQLSRRVLTAAMLCGLPLASQAKDDAVRVRKIVDEAVRPLMTQHDVPGMAVAVTIGGRCHVFSYGVASRETKTPVTGETLFEIGSVSKTYTATLASYARELGKLSLDDHPGAYMPELKDSGVNKASLLHLGTYTAGGLPLQFPDEASGRRGMIDYFRGWKPDNAPGVARRYSNPSLGLFGHIAGLALGSSLTEAMETKLLPGLGLKHTFIRVPEAAMPSYAWGYAKANKPIRVTPGTFGAEAYGIKSSASDMIRYVELNMDPDGLEPALRGAIEGTHVGFFKVGGMVQGLGWEQYPWPVTLEDLLAGNARGMIMESNPATALAPQAPEGPTLFNKTGSTNGFGAYVAFVPEKKIGIVMLANRNTPIPDRIKAAHAILTELAPD
jgi:beta-lactamase class C